MSYWYTNAKCSWSHDQDGRHAHILLLIFISDLPLKLQNIVASTDLNADDTSIYDYDKQVLENNLQRSLVLLQQMV